MYINIHIQSVNSAASSLHFAKTIFLKAYSTELYWDIILGHYTGTLYWDIVSVPHTVCFTASLHIQRFLVSFACFKFNFRLQLQPTSLLENSFTTLPGWSCVCFKHHLCDMNQIAFYFILRLLYILYILLKMLSIKAAQ